jgi:hypothetical protein
MPRKEDASIENVAPWAWRAKQQAGAGDFHAQSAAA